jgi:hypothetical protein
MCTLLEEIDRREAFLSSGMFHSGDVNIMYSEPVVIFAMCQVWI